MGEAVRRGLLKTAGKTPAATMTAQLYLHVRDDPAPRIARLSEPGPIRLRRTGGSAQWGLAGPWNGTYVASSTLDM